MNRWKKEETEKLIKLYNKLDNEESLKHFDRSYTAIYKKAKVYLDWIIEEMEE